ncbi:MAG: hypothetical protein H7834_16635 [Magnetococcus sp. YQC-9]
MEKDHCLVDKNSGACTLDGLTVGENYTIKVFGNAKVKSGSWTTDSGYATDTA